MATATESGQANGNTSKPFPNAHPPGPNEVACPDPAVHSKGSKLPAQASAAALYGPEGANKSADGRSNVHNSNLFDADGKLSSAGAAASLKYAKPQDLPAFPTVGIDTTSSANSAANLANKNRKNPEYWKPDGVSANASKAATLGWDYKMAPLWHPEDSKAGSKAALLAAKDGGKLNLWEYHPSKEGNSAAEIAMHKKDLGPKLDYGYTDEGHRRALMAATSVTGRQRLGSSPMPAKNLYPDQANAGRNALNAATSVSGRPFPGSANPSKVADEISSPALQAARIKNAGRNVPREMYSEHPPVSIELEEKRHQEALRASAVSMAKKMYEMQQKQFDAASQNTDGRDAAVRSHGRQASATSDTGDLKQEAMKYLTLQEAAQRLAAERLAKIKGPDEATAYRDYYGYNEPKSPRHRLSIRGARRRRASSDTATAVDSDDEENARKIRSSMSQFNDQVAQVDAKKRQKDRDALLAAAQKRVSARMHNMDEQVFNETGKMSQSMMDEWEAKARERAQANSEGRMQNHGKVHIGGGKYMDQSEIDAIAQSRIQPTLDEVTRQAEAQQAKDEEARLDREEKLRVAQREKERAAELKAEQKKAKLEEKAATKEQKAAEKAAKAEEKRLTKEDKRKSKEEKTAVTDETVEPTTEVEALPEAEPTTTTTTTTTTASPHLTREITHPDLIAERVMTAPVTDEPATAGILPTTENTAVTLESGEVPIEASINAPGTERPVTPPVAATTEREEPAEVASPTSPSKKKGFFSRFRRSKKADEKEPGKISGFVGGHTLTGSTHSEVDAKSTSRSGRAESSTAPGAMDTTMTGAGTRRRSRSPSPSISSLSSDEEEEVDVRGRSKHRMSGVSGQSGDDEFEEARDTFDDDALKPPVMTSAKNESPVRSTHFKEEL